MVSGNYFGYDAGIYAGASNISLMGLPSVTSTAAAVVAASTSASALTLSVGAGLDTSGKRERTKFNEKQVSILESVFHGCQYPQGIQRESLARELNLTETKVQVWFKNRRAKHRAHAKYEQLKLDVGAGNKRFGTSTNGVSSECNLSSDTGSMFSSASTDSNDPAGSLTAPFAPNDSSLLLQKDGNNGASTAAGGSVGDTENKNEGCSAASKIGAFAVKKEPGTVPRIQFPSSMPMIPLPTANALDDIKPFEKSFDNGMSSNSVVNAAAAAAAAAIFPFSAASGGTTISNSTFLPASTYPHMYQSYNQTQPTVKSQSSAAFSTNGFDLTSMANSFNPLAAAQGWMNPSYPSMLNMMNSFSNGTASVMQNGSVTNGIDFINNSSGSTSAQSAAPNSMISPTAAAAAAAAMSECYAAVATPPICGNAGTQMYDLYNSYYHPSSTSLWDTKLA